MTHKTIEGRCHCGNIQFTVELPWTQEKLPVRECSCSFCRMHGGVYTSDPEGRLQAALHDPEDVYTYQFGTGTAEFHVCRRCGVVPFVTSDISGNVYAVVNVNTFQGIDPSSLSKEVTDFDAETRDDRLDRRASRWIPEVRFNAG